jgi:hypothetical protein
MNKKVFIDLKNLSVKDYDVIKELSIPLIFRYSLKLIRTYPSIKRDEMRENMILDYQEGKTYTDEQKVEEALYSARGFLHHLITYELIMRELNKNDGSTVYHKFDMGVNQLPVEKKNKKNEEKDFEYF